MTDRCGDSDGELPGDGSRQSSLSTIVSSSHPVDIIAVQSSVEGGTEVQPLLSVLLTLSASSLRVVVLDQRYLRRHYQIQQQVGTAVLLQSTLVVVLVLDRAVLRYCHGDQPTAGTGRVQDSPTPASQMYLFSCAICT